MNISQVWPEWVEECILGEGSFGKVFKAKREEFGRTFYSAVKVLSVPNNQQEIKHIKNQGMTDMEVYNYFHSLVDNLLNEITLMDNLKGANNIVGIEDYKVIERENEIGWDIFIRMELLTPFDSFVSNPEFSQIDVIKLGVDICSALEICEQNNIIHRDIKPDNIFISRFGEYKLGDFGIARRLDASKAHLSRKGTLNFMAPEIYRGSDSGASVDIYSLGIVLYTLLNNNRSAFLPAYPQPITYKDSEEALTKRLSGEPLPPPCNANTALGNIILKACAFLPQDRYQSATEFKNALIDEWNNIFYSGENRGLNSKVVSYASDLEKKLDSTTGDMNINGQVVVNRKTIYTPESYDNVSNQNTDYQHSGEAVSKIDESSYSKPHSYNFFNKCCRVLAWIVAIFGCVIGMCQMAGRDLTPNEMAMSAFIVAIGAIVLIADRNKIACGITVSSVALYCITIELRELFSTIHESIPIQHVIGLLCGALLLCAGIIITCQKEIRFGGSFCAYVFVIEYIYIIYQFINDNYNANYINAILGLGMLAFIVFLWSYGYNSAAKNGTVRKVLNVIAYVPAALVLIQVVVFGLKSFA